MTMVVIFSRTWWSWNCGFCGECHQLPHQRTHCCWWDWYSLLEVANFVVPQGSLLGTVAREMNHVSHSTQHHSFPFLVRTKNKNKLSTSLVCSWIYCRMHTEKSRNWNEMCSEGGFTKLEIQSPMNPPCFMDLRTPLCGPCVFLKLIVELATSISNCSVCDETRFSFYI